MTPQTGALLIRNMGLFNIVISRGMGTALTMVLSTTWCAFGLGKNGHGFFNKIYARSIERIGKKERED
jgi:hypothetical protein